jgi:hypothetical protein
MTTRCLSWRGSRTGDLRARWSHLLIQDIVTRKRRLRRSRKKSKKSKRKKRKKTRR